jgi:hypothetical protein
MKTSLGQLTYCTNIHAGKDWDADFDHLRTHFPGIKAAISPEAPMGLGLRLSNGASLALEDPEAFRAFKDWLQEAGVYVFTMNGFPYGAFHHTVVKADVHSPDWTTTERKAYTLRLISILEGLLPEGMDGGISTSPLSYRHWFKDSGSLAEAVKAATLNILEVVKTLVGLYLKTGKWIHLDLEPEPDGLIESGPEYINWYETQLLPLGIPVISSTFEITETEAEALIKQHLCLCYDVCHFSIGYENHAAVLHELQSKGLQVGKIQISAALKARFTDPQQHEQLLDEFSKFNEPTYLHQVVARNAAGQLTRYPDLNEALKDFNEQTTAEWRAHFHVPISVEQIGNLQSTQDDILQVLAIQKQNPFTNHLEVETYTWEVLPEGLKIPIGQSIIKELDWVIKHAIK